jgi:large subunit ribosomal protein L15
VVNVGELETRFEVGAHVTPEAILQAGLIRNLRNKVKILGDGELTKKFKIEAGKFSKAAEEKIKAVGGEIVVS